MPARPTSRPPLRTLGNGPKILQDTRKIMESALHVFLLAPTSSACATDASRNSGSNLKLDVSYFLEWWGNLARLDDTPMLPDASTPKKQNSLEAVGDLHLRLPGRWRIQLTLNLLLESLG